MLEEAGMTPAEVATVVTAHPPLLRVSAKTARPVVRWLLGTAGLSLKQVWWVVSECVPSFARRGATRLLGSQLWTTAQQRPCLTCAHFELRVGSTREPIWICSHRMSVIALWFSACRARLLSALQKPGDDSW